MGQIYPQVLLLGNGLNRAYGGADWEKAVRDIWENKKVSLGDVKDMPYPLLAVVGTDDKVDCKLKEMPDSFYGVKDISELQKPICDLLGIRFDHILTTNFSYEIERVANPKVARDGVYCKQLIDHTDKVKRAEQRYLLHTYNKVVYEGYENKIWHIHGEMRKTQSVVLGHYYYGNLLGKYTKELEALGNRQKTSQTKGYRIIEKSWLDAFIMGDVYVLGFGYDFSEADMWWLLNRKKREKAAHGKFVFYEPTYGNVGKLALLETYGAEIRNLGFWSKPTDYRAFYSDAINDIKKSVEEVRRGELTYV